MAEKKMTEKRMGIIDGIDHAIRDNLNYLTPPEEEAFALVKNALYEHPEYADSDTKMKKLYKESLDQVLKGREPTNTVNRNIDYVIDSLFRNRKGGKRRTRKMRKSRCGRSRKMRKSRHSRK